VTLLFPLVRVSKVLSSTTNLQTLNNSDFEKEMLIKLPAMNKDLPKMLNSTTRLDKIEFKNMKITYNYTLIDSGYSAKIIEKNKKSIQKNACMDKVLSILIKNRVTVVFHYQFNNKNDNIYIEIDSCSEKNKKLN